jgi:hypothetical protein
MYYILDTNIWIDIAQGKIHYSDLKTPSKEMAIAPSILIELVRGVVKGGEARFGQNKRLFECMAQVSSTVLELPRVFVFTVLWKIRETISGVRPQHYVALIDLLIKSNSLADFLSKTEDEHSNWKEMNKLDSIHEGILDKELTALKPLARRASMNSLHCRLAAHYMISHLLPEPDHFEATFSAALEFLIYSVRQVRAGANPLKNNRGLYIDSQLFWYLGDPNAVLVSNEDFSQEIHKSPQRDRIISFAEFLKR